MDAQQFVGAFRYLADAPNGIGRLRNLIVHLAVQGRLVAQDDADEPAASFLARMEKDNAGTRRHSQVFVNPAAERRLPKGWREIQLQVLANPQAGFALKSNLFNESNAGMPIIRVRDVGVSAPATFYSGEYRNEFLVAYGDWLVAMDGDFRVAIWEGPTALLNQRVSRLQFYSEEISKKYVCIALQVQLRKLQGIKNYTTVDHLSGKQISAALIPLPPLEEQSRIVAKFDQLMAFCDQLEKQQQDRHQLRSVLRKSALQAVESFRSYELQMAWNRLEKHFGRLFSGPEDVKELRGLILNLAVRGLLVEQSPSDEPVNAWLARMRARKAELAKKKLVAKQAVYPGVSEEHYPFSIPKNWMFVRLGEITNKIGSGSTPRGGREVYVKEGVPFLRSQNVWNEGLRLADIVFITHQEHERMSGTAVQGNDLLLNITGASLGRCTLVPRDFGHANVSQHVTIIRPTDPDICEYLHLCLLSPYSQALIWGRQVGMAREGLSKKVLEQFEIPMPPVAEQQRIVSRVAELMRLCDELERQLRDRSKLAERLATAAVSNLTGITVEQEEEVPVKAPQTELIAPLRLGQPPDVKAQAPLATILARHQGEMAARDLWQRFGGDIEAFYAQLKTEVAHGWIAEPAVAQMREKATDIAGA